MHGSKEASFLCSFGVSPSIHLLAHLTDIYQAAEQCVEHRVVGFLKGVCFINAYSVYKIMGSDVVFSYLHIIYFDHLGIVGSYVGSTPSS